MVSDFWKCENVWYTFWVRPDWTQATLIVPGSLYIFLWNRNCPKVTELDLFQSEIWCRWRFMSGMSLWLPTRTSSQYENILFSIKYRYANNNLHAILAWCWGSELGVWFNLLGLTVFQCLDSLLFWILRSYCCILFKVKMFILVWVSWSHSCYFY